MIAVRTRQHVGQHDAAGFDELPHAFRLTRRKRAGYRQHEEPVALLAGLARAPSPAARGLPVMATVARLMCRELTLQNEYLRAENKILKSKIKGRIRFTDDDRAASEGDSPLVGAVVRLRVVRAGGDRGERRASIPAAAVGQRVIYAHLIRELKRVSPETPIALCLDTPEMWVRFRDQLGQTSENYVCVCGPMCAPGNPMLRPRRTG